MRFDQEPARLGVLPRFGPGTQVWSWISLSGEVATIRFLLHHGDLSGPVNLTAPHPVTNSAFTAALEHALHRPDMPWLRVPAWSCALPWARAPANC